MKPSAISILSAALLALSITACRTASLWTELAAGDYRRVERGRYHGSPQYLPHPGPYEETVNRCRAEIENHHESLASITRSVFPVAESLCFEYKFASVDQDSQAIILRYFARIRDHRVIAGFQIQFVYDLRSTVLRRVLTAEVPLE